MQTMPFSNHRIFNFLSQLAYEKIPSAVVHEAKRAVLDTLGCIIAGIDTPLGEELRKLAGRFTDNSGAKVLGLNQPITPVMAAMVNSYLANAHDADDGHRRSRLHAGGIIISAALAAVEENGGSSRKFLEAIIAGFELGHRAGMAMTALDTYYGSALGSTFGATAAVGWLMDLTPEQILNAMGIAEIQAPNCMLMGWVEARKPPMIKEGVGWSAVTGIMSAYMAQTGITGTLTVFNGREAISEIEKIGLTYETLRRFYKPHPGCRWTQGPLECLKTLMAQNDIHVQEVESIHVLTITKASHLDNPTPATMDEAQYSIPFVLAAALVDGEFGPDQMRAEKLIDPDILAIARRVKIKAEPEFDKYYPEKLQCQVSVTTRNSSSFLADSQKVKGDHDYPLSDVELEKKFVGFTRERLKTSQSQSIVDAIWSLDTLDNMKNFIASIHTLTL